MPVIEPTEDRPRVNGNVTSWGHIYFKLLNKKWFGIVDISYGHKRERVEGAGLGKHHVANRVSAGKYTTEISKVKMFKASASAFRAALASASPDGISYGNTEFEGLLQFIPPDEQSQMIELRRCTYRELSFSASESADPLFDEIGVKPLWIVENGKTLFDASEGMP